MQRKVNNIVKIPTSLDNFFRLWFSFLHPFHKLTEREIDVITSLVKHRYIYSKSITDDDLLEKITMSEETKKMVREECNLTHPHFQVIMSKLRKANILLDNKINPRYIPNIGEDTNNFQLLLYFDINNEV